MSGTDWNELERAWQSLPANASPVVEELKRARRWQWWSHVYLAGEIVIGIAGFAAAGWLFWRGGTFSIVMGLATIVFVAVTGGTSLWARLLPHARLLAISRSSRRRLVSLATGTTSHAAMLRSRVLLSGLASYWQGRSSIRSGGKAIWRA
jgi:hypothetical protein